MGRRKIAIEKIENKNIRNVTFTKRRQGLFKKAAAARDKYGLRIAVVVFSPAGKPYTFGDSSVIDQFLESSSSSSSLLNPTLPLHLNSSVEEEENVDFEGKKKRIRDGDDLQVIMEKADTKRRKMITITEEEVKQGLILREDSQNFNSDEIEEELKNYDEGFNKQIVNEQRLVVELLEEEKDFESQGNKDSSSEILVDYVWPSNEEVNQLIDDNNGTVDADHNMFSLPSLHPPPNLSNDSTSSYMNTTNQEDDATVWSTLEEWFY